MEKIPEKKKAPLSTLVKGLKILEFVVKAERLVRLRDVAEAFSMDRSVALRFLKTLQYAGYIEKYEEIKAYSAGPMLAELHRPLPAIERLVARIKPYLVRLGQESGQSAHIGVLEGNHAILVGVASSPGRISVKQAVGDLDPLYSSAVGKAIYAFLPDQERLRYGRAITFNRFTDNTIENLEALEHEAALIRDNGVAFDDREGSEDVSCIAGPLFNKDNRVIASIGISMVAGLIRGPLTEQHQLIVPVQAIAKDILNDGVAE
jgi:DNA-binding IclR family transcriptional regulator